MNFSRIDYLAVRNYRNLDEIELHDLTPMTVLLGPPRSGKSTVLDVFAFLSEAYKIGLRDAWHKRGGLKKLNPRRADAPIVFEIRFREREDAPSTTYHLKLREQDKGPAVEEEWIQWRGTRYGGSFRFVDLKHNRAMSRARLDIEDDRPFETITPADVLSLSCLDQFPKHPRVAALRQFIDSWHFSHVWDDAASMKLTQVGRPVNAQSITQLLRTLRKLPSWTLDKVFRRLQMEVQSFEQVNETLLHELRQLLSVKETADDDAAAEALIAKLGSDVTLKMFNYLATLYQPDPLQPLLIDLPEDHQTVKLVSELAKECRSAIEHSQLIVTTHSAGFANLIKPRELWIISKSDEGGITRARRASDAPGLDAYLMNGVLPGELWTRGFFDHVPHPTAGADS